MMISFEAAQKELFQILSDAFPVRFFLKRDNTDLGLWVTDLPRRLTNPQQILLPDHYIHIVQKGLMHIRWSPDRWQHEIDQCEKNLPVFPDNTDQFQALYAIARLLLAHPCTDSISTSDCESLFKLTAQPRHLINHEAAQLLSEYAARLRKHYSLPYTGAYILIDYLNREVQQ